MDWDKVETISKTALHRGDIILVDGKTWTSSLIKWGTWSPVSHVAMAISYDEVVESLGKGPTRSTNSTDVACPSSPDLEGWLAQLTHALVMRHKNFESRALQDQLCDYALSRVNNQDIPYDMDKIYQLAGSHGVARWQWNRTAKWTKKTQVAPGYPAKDDEAFICSEFVVRMYELTGYPIIDAACWVSPGDFVHVGWDQKPYPTDNHLRVIGKLK